MVDGFASRACGWGLKQCPNLLSLRSGIAKGAINAAWDAIGEVKDGLRLTAYGLRVSAYGLGAYCLREDGTPTISSKLSAVSKVLKWIFWILIGLIGLIITVKVCLRKW